MQPEKKSTHEQLLIFIAAAVMVAIYLKILFF
jgi:hypothetical protein